MVLLRKSGDQANYLKNVIAYVRRMIVYTTCNPLNFLWAPFSLKEPPHLLDYYMFSVENLKILESGGCLFGQAAA